MMKVTFVLSLIAFTSFIFTLLPSCNKCGPYKSFEYTYHTLDSIKPQLKKITGQTGTKETRQYLVLDNISENESVRYDSLVIELAYNFQETKKFTFSTWAFNAAYACEVAPEAQTHENVNKVEITSSEDYNDTLKAGTDLSKIIFAHQDKVLYGLNLSTFVRQTPILEREVHVIFSISPSETKSHNLTFKYFLAAGREVSTTVNNVLIKK